MASYTSRSIIFFFFIHFVNLSFAQTISYEWENVNIGGGGYAVDLQTHPNAPDLKYLSNDVGGLFKWNAQNEKWVSVRDKVHPEESNLIGCDGFSLDKNNPNIIYGCFGKYSCYEGGIFKSVDYGENWEELYSTPFGSNQERHRVQGNIIVDPNNSNVIYCGTRTEGLLISTNGGENWSKIESVPLGHIGDESECYWNDPALGIRSIVIDPNETIASSSSKIYVAVFGLGIYFSGDAGQTFSLLENSPADVNRMAVFDSGLICTSDNGVFKYHNNSWSNISPSNAVIPIFNGISIDPQNENNLLCATGNQTFFQEIFRSTDGGLSWIKLDPQSNSTFQQNVPWFPNLFFQAAISFVHFDQLQSNKAYFGDWTSVWETNDIWADEVIWEQKNFGYEVGVNLALCTPPSGPSLYTGFADILGFKHEDVTQYPTSRLYSTSECTSIDYQEDQPANIAGIISLDWEGQDTKIMTSVDNGTTVVLHDPPTGAVNGKIAVAKNDPLNMVYLPAKSQPYFTINGGETWEQSSGISNNEIIATTSIFQYDEPLIADKTNDNSFFVYDRFEGILYFSSNGGMDFVKLNEDNPLPPSPWAFCNVQKSWTETTANDLWVSIGYLGLWHSTDGGVSFSKIDFLGGAILSALGKEIHDANPTVYAYGWDQNEDWGIFRSIDNGTTWNRINDENSMIGNRPSVFAADRQIAGRVYVGTNGRGVFYGEEAVPTSVISTHNSKAADINVYPNPTAGEFFIDLPSSEFKIEVLDQTGKTCSTIFSKTSHQKVLINSLPNGLYFIKATDQNGTATFLKKVIKQ